MKKALGWVLSLTLFFAVTTAKAELAMDQLGLRYEALEGESCLTADSAKNEEKLLESLHQSEDEARATMAGAQIAMQSELPDGRHIRLTVSDAPDGYGIEHIWVGQPSQEEIMGMLMEHFGASSGEWMEDDTGYALMECPINAIGTGGAPAMALTELRLCTLYLGKLIALETDVIGREPDQDDTALLTGAADRLLRLGKQDAGEGELAQVVPQMPDLLSGPAAEVTVLSDQLPITVDPVCADYPSTSFFLSGKTKAATAMRYYINGEASSRFYSKDDGSFRVTVPSLVGGKDNEIRVAVMQDDQKGEVSFTLHVEKKPAPINLSAQFGCVSGDTITLKGQALAGSKVAFAKRSAKSTIKTEKDGSCAITLKLPNVGVNTVSLLVTLKGYLDNKVELSFVRLPENSAQLDKLVSDTPSIDYQTLLANPEEYAGNTMALSGTVSDLRYHMGKTYALIENSEGEKYVCCPPSLYEYKQGLSIRLLALVLGQPSDAFTEALPQINPLAILTD